MSETVWEKIREAIKQKVSVFNGRGGEQFKVSPTASTFIQVVGNRLPVEPVVVQVDPNTTVIQFDSTIARPGVPRRDFFTINPDGLIVLKEHSVGQPMPPSDPMSPEQFADFVLVTAFQLKTA